MINVLLQSWVFIGSCQVNHFLHYSHNFTFIVSCACPSWTSCLNFWSTSILQTLWLSKIWLPKTPIQSLSKCPCSTLKPSPTYTSNLSTCCYPSTSCNYKKFCQYCKQRPTRTDSWLRQLIWKVLEYVVDVSFRNIIWSLGLVTKLLFSLA